MTGVQTCALPIFDASLIGGVKVRYEDKELDGTIAGRLAAMRQALMS